MIDKDLGLMSFIFILLVTIQVLFLLYFFYIFLEFVFENKKRKIKESNYDNCKQQTRTDGMWGHVVQKKNQHNKNTLATNYAAIISSCKNHVFLKTRQPHFQYVIIYINC